MLAIPFSAVASTEEGRSSAVGLASGGISPAMTAVADGASTSVSAMTSHQRGRACSPAVCEALNRGRSWGGWERFHSPWVGRNGWGTVTDRDHSLPQEQRCLVEVRSHTHLTLSGRRSHLSSCNGRSGWLRGWLDVGRSVGRSIDRSIGRSIGLPPISLDLDRCSHPRATGRSRPHRRRRSRLSTAELPAADVARHVPRPLRFPSSNATSHLKS